MVVPSRSRRASSTPSPTPASSAATSFEISSVSTTSRLSVGRDSFVPLSSQTRALFLDSVTRRGADAPLGARWAEVGAGRPARRERELGELLADELTDRRAVGAAGDLRHHVRHHATEVAQARRAAFRDRVVDDPLQLVLDQRLRHELLEDVELELLGLRLLLPAAFAERVGRLDSLLALALQDLQLLRLAERPLKLLLRRLQAREDQAQRVAALRVSRAHRLLHLFLQPRNQRRHSAGTSSASSARPRTLAGSSLPPRMCQCRWNTVWPAPGPTFTRTR